MAIIIGVLSILVVFYLISTPNDNTLQESGKPVVVTSFYPLQDIVLRIVGDTAMVINPIPAGAEVHSFSPTVKEITQVLSSRAFIYHGAGLDPWAEDLSKDALGRGVTVYKVTDNFLLSSFDEHDDADHGDEDHGDMDPHIWLDPVLMQEMVQNIGDVLISAFPEYADTYKVNIESYKNELSDLHSEYVNGLSNCRLKKAVVAHDAFNYLAKRYSLDLLSISGVSPQSAPSAKKLAELAQLIEENDIKYVFFETLTTPKLSQTLAKEVGVGTLVLNPIEGLTMSQLDSGDDYVKEMKQNLRNLQSALECN